MSAFKVRQKHSDYSVDMKGTGAAASVTPLQRAGKVARGIDRVLTALVAFFLAVVFLYACYALWDTWRIYDGAGVDEDLLKYKPSLLDNGESLAELAAINPDVCAWLTIDDTNIDYPVVRGSDNVKYVNTDVYGDFSLSGSIFLDYRNSRTFSDNYSLLYGHHMSNGAMFGDLDSFSETEFFNTHQTGTLYLLSGAFRIKIFACMKVDAYDALFYSPGNLQETQMQSLLTRAANEAVQFRDIDTNSNVKVIALSTCSDTTTNGRTVVLGYLEELTQSEGEVNAGK